MSEENKIEKNKLSTKKYWLILITLLAVIGAIFLIFENLKYQSTDDAYVETTMVTKPIDISFTIIPFRIAGIEIPAVPKRM